VIALWPPLALTEVQLVGVIVLGLVAVVVGLAVKRRSWPDARHWQGAAIGALGAYGGFDLVRFSLTEPHMTPLRCVWLLVVGCGLMVKAAQTLWEQVLKEGRTGKVVADVAPGKELRP